jgi:hypothetical protein
MVSNAYQRQIVSRTMAEVERMAAAGSEVYDLLTDERIAATSRALAAALGDFREAVRLYAISHGLAGTPQQRTSVGRTAPGRQNRNVARWRGILDGAGTQSSGLGWEPVPRVTLRHSARKVLGEGASMMLEYSVNVASARDPSESPDSLGEPVERFRSVSYERALAVCDRLNRHGQAAGMRVSVVETIDDYCDVACCDTSERLCHCGDCPACM